MNETSLVASKRKKQLKRLLPLIPMLLLFLSGCALMEPTNPYAPASRRKTLAGGGYAQPIPPPTPEAMQGPLPLDRCIEVALANNPEVAATGWEATASTSRLDQAKAARWPTLSIEGAYTRHLDPQRLIQARYNGEPGIFDTDIYRGDLVLKMPIFTGGRIINEIAAADLIRKAEENRLARTRQELVFNVSSTFYSILGQHRTIRSLEFSINAMEEHFRRVSALLEAEKAAKVDLLRTEVRLSDLRQSLVKEQNVLAIQKRVLANLLGLDYDTERFAIEGKLTFEEVSLEADPLIALALRGRSDYQGARARLEAQAKKLEAARAGHLPTVSLVGNYGMRMDGREDNDDVGTIGVGATIPLFEGGRVTAKIQEERAVLAAAQERLRKLELQIRQDVETAVLDIRAGSERVRAIEKSVEQARESLRIEREKYDLGMGSITDVLDAQSAFLQAETTYYKALADFRTALARLDFAIGGRRP